MQKHLLLPLGAVLLSAACADVPRPTALPTTGAPGALQPSASRGGGAGRFVVIGTSISMGWASNGVYDLSQVASWPSLLAFASGHPMSVPRIQSPGCISPLIAPLGAGLRLSGESAAGSSVCAPLDAGVTLPTQNLGIAGALAVDALQTTMEAGVAAGSPWYARVLPPGATQLTAALAQSPTFVTVELGGNEVLGSLSGLVVPGVTIVPLPYFAAPYDAIVGAVAATGPKVLLFEMPTTPAQLPALRRGDEIWADRAEFAALHVDVSADCSGSPNYINVAVASLNLVFQAAYTSTHGLPDPVFSCADVPGTQDLVLTPADIAAVNALLAQMRAHVEQQAASHGYALASLGALYDLPNLKPATYSVVSQLTSPFPYGLLISLDGVHPSALGNALLATAAARAINATYHGLDANVVRRDTPALQLLPAAPDAMGGMGGSPLEQARRIATAHQGLRLPACSLAMGCGMRR